jgi:hypothetical protein
MFTSGQQVIDVPLGIARSRLANLIHDGWLTGASAEVYEHSADDLLRVGPFGEARSPSRLVRVQFTDPSYRDDAMRVGLRWEALGVTGGLFPALDADISLTAQGERGTLVGLTGTYRPPLGPLGAGLDRLVLRKVATATVTAFLSEVSGALAATQAPAMSQSCAPPRERNAQAQHHPCAPITFPADPAVAQ